MHVLRAEKGYIITGQETDGTVTPGDVGLDWAIGKTKRDFVGKRSLLLPDLAAPGRRQLVGLAPASGAAPEEGAQVIADGAPIGHVTSAYPTGSDGRCVVLAMIADGRARLGQSVAIQMPPGELPARVVSPVFVDPEGTRLHA